MERIVLTVSPHDGAWAVERAGEFSGFSSTKDEAKAAAHKQARQLQDSGQPCQVVVAGESGFFTGRIGRRD